LRNKTGRFFHIRHTIRITTSSALSNNLRGVNLKNDAELQNWFDNFFKAKPADFFKHGIENLPECWEAEYIID
jgi:hypothetical protein